MTQHDQDMEMLRACARSLGEHFDSVQIFASRHEAEVESGTIGVCTGVGNIYSRYGQAAEWVNAFTQQEPARKEEE